MTDIINALEDFKRNEEPKRVASISTDNYSLNYDIVDINKKVPKDYNEKIDAANFDYLIPRDEDAKKRGFKEDLPISFLQIKEGEVERGKQWYLWQYPKLPEQLAEIMARYNWGDLRYQTKKKIKNDKKKAIKKGKKYAPLSIEIKRGKYVVEFD